MQADFIATEALTIQHAKLQDCCNSPPVQWAVWPRIAFDIGDCHGLPGGGKQGKDAQASITPKRNNLFLGGVIATSYYSPIPKCAVGMSRNISDAPLSIILLSDAMRPVPNGNFYALLTQIAHGCICSLVSGQPRRLVRSPQFRGRHADTSTVAWGGTPHRIRANELRPPGHRCTCSVSRRGLN